MKKSKLLSWQLWLGLCLILLSALLYWVHYVIFRDLHHIAIYLIGDIAFVPIEVLIVTLIIHRILESHERKILLEKMNMVIGAFYSEVGNDLIRMLASFSKRQEDLVDAFKITPEWTDQRLASASKTALKMEFALDSQASDLGKLKRFLSSKHDFMLRILENPVLIEHDTFTDLLWATFHLTEELALRQDVLNLPKADYEHLSGDMVRVFGKLLSEWLNYLRHLKTDYPFLYSLAIRNNPFVPEASVVIKG